MLDTVPDKHAPADGAVSCAPMMRIRGVNFWYGDTQVLRDVNLDIRRGEILAFMGPSGCGKSTLLKLLNRMQDDVPGASMTGSITLDGNDIHDPDLDPVLHRRRFGWVAQQPNPFPASVRENVAYGPRLHGLVNDDDLDTHVQNCLVRAELWAEVSDRLDEPGTSLSGGQQQRLCIARALSICPDLLLMDEPCSAIDPIATAAIEKLILGLRKETGIVIITHNLHQARRIADRVAFFHMGNLIETGPTDLVFDQPSRDETRRYLSGAFG